MVGLFEELARVKVTGKTLESAVAASAG
jgi:hypothetical protein